MDPDERPPGRTRITPQQRALRYDGGGPVLNLLLTVGRPGGGGTIERLPGPELLARWCTGAGLPLRPGADTAELLAALREFREAAYDVLRAAVHDGPPAPGSVVAINRAAAVEPPVPVLHGVRVWRAPLDGPALIAVLARDLLDLLADPDRRALLRICASGHCEQVFQDTAGGRARRWCGTRCGNAAKAATHRARTRVG